VTERVSLTLTEDQHAELKEHLFPGDGLEAVAFLACGRAAGAERHRLVVRSVHPIPHADCRRTMTSVHWNGESIVPLMECAEVDGLSLVKVHSHPQGYAAFSTIDDMSDADLLPTIHSWVERDVPHGSAIMLPDGTIFGRYLWRTPDMAPLVHVNVAGPDLQFWRVDDAETAERTHQDSDGFGASQDQAFGEGTTRRLKKLKIGIVGASGTGSPTIEQLARLGVGELVIVDDDHIEHRNLNRILFATAEHADKKGLKVDAAEEDLSRKALGTKVTSVPKSITDPQALRELSTCDILFGCVDTQYGRFIMNLLSTYYLIPLFDLGVLLDAVTEGPGRGTIKDILGTVHYIVPGRSSLISREVISLADVAAEGLHANDPAAARQQVEDRYITGLQVRRPAVVSVNMFASALAVNDLLARLHSYRKRPNADVAAIEFSLGELRLTADEELEDCLILRRGLGCGDTTHWLGMPELGHP
jgi:ThiF family/Prokaryotic homologs of the JAB domain